MKKILLISSNQYKLKEFQIFFSLYGIIVEMKSDINFERAISIERDYFAIIREETFLINDSGAILNSNINDFEKVFTYSTFKYFLNGKTVHLHSNKVQGYVDLTTKDHSSDIFGWDDVFIISSLGISLHQLTKINSKVIGRQSLLAQFAQKELYYEDRLDLNYNPQNQTDTINLDFSVFNFLISNKYLNCNSVKESGYSELLLSAFDNGAFFRSAKNRKEKNYWFPGLNGTIPLVGKSDEIHEITFAAHDFTHFLLPDMIFDGNDFELSRKTYIMLRMMSEAITIVLADGWFIQNLSKYTNYNYDKRNIYPLFQDLNLDDMTVLKNTIRLMISYCLTGENKYLLDITSKQKDIDAFKLKYEPFFVEDYKWTIKNYENMCSSKEYLSKWISDNQESFKSQGLDTFTDVKNKAKLTSLDSNDETIDKLSTYMLDRVLPEVKKPLKNKNEMLSNSFKKYMLGQIFIFYKYDFLLLSSGYKCKIQEVLNSDKVLNLSDIVKVTNFYKDYLDQLYLLNLIDIDQRDTYKEIYPIYNPYYVYYDKSKDYYSSLSDVYYKTFNKSLS